MVIKFQSLPMIFILLVSIHFSKTSANFQHFEFERRLKALQNVVEFMIQRPKQMNVDAIFGLTLAEAHLVSLLRHSNSHFLPKDQQKKLRGLVKICDDARQVMKETVKPESKFVAFLNERLNNPEPWIHEIEWKKDLLERPILGKVNKTLKNVFKVIYNGAPDEEESDYCIAGMLRGFPQEQCEVREECERMLLKEDNPQGYATTHRLLLIWIAKAFQCKDLKIIPNEELTQKYCSLILQNLIDIESLEFPPPSPDLLMEEVLLCGSEGYLEFTNDHLVDLILNWQHPSGCYSSSSKQDENGFRRRRAADKIDFGCENHATGIAAGCIALFLRNFVETCKFN